MARGPGSPRRRLVGAGSFRRQVVAQATLLSVLLGSACSIRAAASSQERSIDAESRRAALGAVWDFACAVLTDWRWFFFAWAALVGVTCRIIYVERRRRRKIFRSRGAFRWYLLTAVILLVLCMTGRAFC